MYNPDLVKVGSAQHDLRELKVIRDGKAGVREETASRLTSRKRFTSGLDLVYSITFPFRIQSETMQKHRHDLGTVVDPPNSCLRLVRFHRPCGTSLGDP